MTKNQAKKQKGKRKDFHFSLFRWFVLFFRRKINSIYSITIYNNFPSLDCSIAICCFSFFLFFSSSHLTWINLILLLYTFLCVFLFYFFKWKKVFFYFLFQHVYCRAFVRILCVCCPRKIRRKYQPTMRSKSQVSKKIKFSEKFFCKFSGTWWQLYFRNLKWSIMQEYREKKIFYNWNLFHKMCFHRLNYPSTL